MTTPLDLASIKARLAVATDGPWRVQGGVTADGFVCADTCLVDGGDGESVIWQGENGIEATPGDADFIANAPSDLAALIGEVERLRSLHEL